MLRLSAVQNGKHRGSKRGAKPGVTGGSGVSFWRRVTAEHAATFTRTTRRGRLMLTEPKVRAAIKRAGLRKAA